MESESRPGSPARINLGASYAQPVHSWEASPTGGDLSRLESYMGDRNCGAPYTSDEERQSENIAEAGDKKGSRAAEIEIFKRLYAIRDKASEIFTAGSINV